MTLKTYLQINRMGLAIDPPTRKTVERLVARADKNKDSKLTREELRVLTPILGARLGSRVFIFVFTRFVVSPYLAWKLVDWLEKNEALLAALQRAVPQRLADVAGKMLYSSEAWRTVFLMLFMTFLGGMAMDALNAFLRSSEHELERKALGDA